MDRTKNPDIYEPKGDKAFQAFQRLAIQPSRFVSSDKRI